MQSCQSFAAAYCNVQVVRAGVRKRRTRRSSFGPSTWKSWGVGNGRYRASLIPKAQGSVSSKYLEGLGRVKSESASRLSPAAAEAGTDLGAPVPAKMQERERAARVSTLVAVKIMIAMMLVWSDWLEPSMHGFHAHFHSSMHTVDPETYISVYI